MKFGYSILFMGESQEFNIKIDNKPIEIFEIYFFIFNKVLFITAFGF